MFVSLPPFGAALDAALRLGGMMAIGRELYTIERIEFEQRLHGVEWWKGSQVSRDYLRLWLKGPSGIVEALVFVDRETGARYLHALCD